MKPIHVPTRYEAYLQTEQFDEIRQAVFRRDGYKCFVCDSTTDIQPHHLTYRNVYHEPTRDLITLCRKCHSIFHAVDRQREIVERLYQQEDERREAEYAKQQAESETAWQKAEKESQLITAEIKEEYLPKDYCKNGDLDMVAWEVLNPIIAKKCKEHGIRTWLGSKNELRAFFQYRRCEFLLKCMDKGLSFEKVKAGTKLDSQWLWKWYRRDKCEAKINEEKELYKEVVI